MTDRVGSLRPGKQADVIPLRLENINRQRRHSALGMLTPVEYELRTPPVA